MTFQEVQTALRTRPFKPFRLYVSGGETFDVRHSELCVPGLTSVFIGFPSEKDAESVAYERFTIIDLEHVIRLEPLESKAKKTP
jgi:hypothetical protein